VASSGERLHSVTPAGDWQNVWNFGFLEHLRETRFTVPKITLFGTLASGKSLQFQACRTIARAKIARIRAGSQMLQMFQNSIRNTAIAETSTAEILREVRQGGQAIQLPPRGRAAR